MLRVCITDQAKSRLHFEQCRRAYILHNSPLDVANSCLTYLIGNVRVFSVECSLPHYAFKVVFHRVVFSAERRAPHGLERAV
jgi:hypothetical protein